MDQTVWADQRRVSNVVHPDTLARLQAVEKQTIWHACWMIHNANHLRPSRDGLKVGGHQASSTSLSTVMTALYFDVLRPQDRVAVKPHASPLFHAMQYIAGQQSQDQLARFRGLGGAQSYPSRTKDSDDVDFSTGSVGLGVGITLFAAMVRDYVRLHRFAEDADLPPRMVAIMGDAELDEGNIYEALLEGWKHDVRNLWWVIDYNRQSLDGVVSDFLFQRVQDFFRSVGWSIVTIKYGKRLQAAFEGPAGEALQQWIDTCPNQLYSALTYKGGAAWRARLQTDLGGTVGLKALLDGHDDAALAGLMTNLGGHDMESLLEAFHAVEDDRPHAFIAYTIKGFGTPLAGHKDNHAGLMTPDQMAGFQASFGVPAGAEWDRWSAFSQDQATDLDAFVQQTPFRQPRPRANLAAFPVPQLPTPAGATQSTQAAFGKIMNDLARSDAPMADRVVTTSPDVTVSTNLGGWVNQRGVFHRQDRPDLFRVEKVASALKWHQGPSGQHIELGIAENNLFLMLGALGLSHQLLGQRLLPVGTLYDPFIARGLDALNYACYQDARFLVVATPSGLTLAPEGGAHQSISTPLIGMAQDGLASFEPAYADELAAIMAWAFDYMQRDGAPADGADWLRDRKGGSVYLRLSTRELQQPDRVLSDDLRSQVIAGGYWLRAPAPGAELALVYTGAIAAEAAAAFDAVLEDVPGAGLLAVTSADRLNAGWTAAEAARQARGETPDVSHVERLLAPLAPSAKLVTVLDGHPATLAWLGAVRGHRTRSLGVEHFGQSGDLQDLYRTYRIDSDAILNAVAAACLDGQTGAQPG